MCKRRYEYAESSDSYLAQGGMCMLKDDSDYDRPDVTYAGRSPGYL